ncbi:MAG: ATP-binding protein [Dehalococcoidales bacterium]|nr:ATP-binding protein [Dehalococcoidales bacterium]
MTKENSQRLGIVVAGSLDRGVEVRLDSSASVEEMVVGRYVTIEGEKRRFFGMITDISLGVTDQILAQTPPDVSDSFIAEVLAGTATYGTLHVLPMLTIGGSAAELIEGPQPVKTVPTHFSPVKLAAEEDIELVFGKEDKDKFHHIGNPLDMETKLCINLEEFVKRSNGIFGKSGTGKTYFTRLMLIGMLQKSKAVNLVFDMHSEYGWAGSREGGGSVKALKQLFPANVAVFTLDEESSRRRKVSTDFVVRIGYDEITPEDISILRSTLNITDLAVEAAYQLRKILGKNWLEKVLETDDESIGEIIKDASIHESSLQSLKRGLGTIGRLGFIVKEAHEDTVKRILDYLARGINVVLEFGRYREISAYLLVANMLSRRIYNRYQQQMEEAIAADDEALKPKPLVITIEEAHKFLSPEVASKTIFGTIAREMRKYNVTLLVIDQRPSGIDEEVMSQMGTKISYLLDNEKDVDSVLAGVSGKSELKAVVARLSPRRQAIIFGHSVPMPVTFETREYGSAASYKDFALSGETDLQKQAEKDIEELWN